MFKVVPDQLKISEGWVRCGQCSEIFDASAHLQAAAPASAQAAVEHAPPSVVGQRRFGAGCGDRPESEAFGMSPSSEIDEGLLSESPDSALIDAEALALQEHPLDQPFELRRQDAAEEEDTSSSRKTPGSSPNRNCMVNLTFVRQARRQASGVAPPFVR